MIADPLSLDRLDDGSFVLSELVSDFDCILRNYLRGRGVAEADAEDIAQEVYVKLLRCLPYLELTSRCFRGWLRRVAERALADRRRGEGRRRRIEAEWFRRRPEALREDDRREILDEVLQQVRRRTSPKTWRCFEAMTLQQRRIAEVAAECGLTVNAVRVRASRVLTRLRRLCRASGPARH